MKLYVTDLDGTLLDHNAAVDNFSAEILNREIKNGVNFTFATARSIYSAMPIMKNINLTLPVITQNGVFITDPKTGKHIVSHFFNNEQIDFIKNFFKEHNEELLIYTYIGDEEKVNYIENPKNKGVRRYLKDRKGDKRLNPCKTLDEVISGDIYYITLISPKMTCEQLDGFFSFCNGFARNYQPDTYAVDEFWYEIYREDVSKANAVLKLKEMLGADEITVFGDNRNDISMFEKADRCYAVANASPELKNISDGIIRSNEQGGVPVFIADENCIVRQYEKHALTEEPDKIRFREIVNSDVHIFQGIGTLNEKKIHSVLKSYFSESNIDKEIKIGKFYADLVTENGIVEIQTKNFKKLIPKLDVFLQSSHVTVVYPYHKITRLNYISKETGELLKTGYKVNHNDINDMLVEFYRIKQFLNNKNLTVCIAELEVEKYRVASKDMKRRKSDTVYSEPVELLRLIYLEDEKSYEMFIPKDAPDRFTYKQLQNAGCPCDPRLLVKILTFLGLVEYDSKSGNEYIFKKTSNNS